MQNLVLLIHLILIKSMDHNWDPLWGVSVLEDKKGVLKLVGVCSLL